MRPRFASAARPINLPVRLTVVVAQLVRAPDCGSGGRRFKSGQPPFTSKHRRNLALDYLPTVGSAARSESQKNGTYRFRSPTERVAPCRFSRPTDSPSTASTRPAARRSSRSTVATTISVRTARKASKLEYDRLTAEWLASGRQVPAAGSDLTIVEMLAAFRRWARQALSEGRSAHSRGRQPRRCRPAAQALLRPRTGPRFRSAEAEDPASDHDPRLHRRQRQGIQGPLPRCHQRSDRPNQARLQVGRVGRTWRRANLAHALATVTGLQFGRTDARETAPIKPVSEEDVEAVLPHLPAVVADMVRFQKLTGARPG